jgi:hypothetical protein
MAAWQMLDRAFLGWLREETERRWRDTALPGPDGLAWVPGTRWRGGISTSDLEIAEAQFELRFPAAYRAFLAALHTPDPPLVGSAYGGRGLVRLEARVFPDWTGPVLPLVDVIDAPVDGLIRAVEDGRWHPAWGERPTDRGRRATVVRRLAGAAPRLIPVGRGRYLAVSPGNDDGPVLAAHGASVRVVAPDLRAALLAGLELEDPDAAGGVPPVTAPPVPFWQDVIDGLAWASEAVDRP